jgi:dTDP-glucose 4,6-dehydratase
VIPTIITQALTQSSVKLGNLHTTRDFNFVSDIVEAFIAIAEAPEAVGKTVNIGSGIDISIRELAEVIFELTGVKRTVDVEEIRLRPEASEVEHLCANSLLLTKLTGWRPKVSLREGLMHTIEWMEHNLKQYAIGSYSI